MAETPHDELTPCSLLTPSTLPFSSPMFPTTISPSEHSSEISTMFSNMRYLHLLLESRTQPFSPAELQVIDQMRTTILARLVALGQQNTRPRSQWSRIDYSLEGRRLAALICVKAVLLPKPMIPTNPTACELEYQLISYLHQGERNSYNVLGVQPKSNQVSWALWIGAIFAQDDAEINWFGKSIAKGCRITVVKTWKEMESRLEKICWRSDLRTNACRRVWRRVEEINRVFWEGTE